MAKNLVVSLKQFQALEETIRCQSYTEAAKSLGVSQPTVSNLVLAAESQFGCKLIGRENGQICATQMYTGIRGKVVALLALSGEIEATLAGYRDLSEAVLRIGYSTYQIAMPLVSRFAQEYPGVELTARALASYDLLPLIQSGELDIGFITAQECPPEIEGLLVTPTRIGVVLPAAHVLADKPTLDWADLADQKFLQREHSSGTRRLFEAAARVANAEITTVLGLGSWGSIASLVRNGVGLGVALETECQNEQGLVFKPIEDRNLLANHYLVYLPSMKNISPVRAFCDLHERV